MPQILFHIHLEIWMAGGLTLFGVYPVLAHLVRGWRIKRDDIFTSLDSNAKRLYLETFQRRSDVYSPDKEFEQFYNSRYGRRNFIVPALALLLVLVPLCYVMSVTALTQVNVLSPTSGADVFSILNATAPYISLPPIAAGGIVGAYLWIVAELIVSMQQLNLAPSDVLRATLRLIIAAPLGYAISSLVSPGIAPFVAFAVGAFPLDQIGLALRKIADKQLNLGMDVGGQPGQVTHLEGVDGPTAERLREANVTTVAQLAYFDPVQLCMRTGLIFDFVLDIVGQALAWVYFGDKLNTIRPSGLRGSIEITNLYSGLSDGNVASVTLAGQMLDLAAKLADIDPLLFRNACSEIAGDPANEFLMEVWAGTLTVASEKSQSKLRAARKQIYANR